MADRTDIDALLVSALYGELEPADEARLAAHLESHPADRTALADLTLTRQAVRESRMFDAQLEPPQAVSARLLQEAARSSRPAERARDDAGWLLRFLRSFAAHPAMAAAAMLVVVVGVAGTLYVRGHDPFTDMATSAEPASVTTSSAPAAASAPAQPTTTDVARQQANEGNAAAVPAPSREVVVQQPAPMTASEPLAPPPTPATKASPPAPATKANGDVAKSSGVAGIELRRNELQPKDLDGTSERPAERAGGRAKVAKRDTVGARDSELAADRLQSPPAGAASASPPPPAAEPVAADDRKAEKPEFAKPPPPPAAVTRASKKTVAKPAPDASETKDGSTWVRRQHEQVVALVRANDCRGAASAAGEIYDRAPDYYAANIAGDRTLRPCKAYIDSERDRVATKRAKALEPENARSVPAPEPRK